MDDKEPLCDEDWRHIEALQRLYRKQEHLVRNLKILTNHITLLEILTDEPMMEMGLVAYAEALNARRWQRRSSRGRHKGTMTAEERRQVSERLKRYWASRRAHQEV